MPTALDTSPDPPQPATPPNTPQPPTQQGSAPQRANGDVENRRQAETSAAPGSRNSAASNGASMPSYGLADLGLRDSNTASKDTHTKNGA
jgi:hypothetical protein